MTRTQPQSISPGDFVWLSRHGRDYRGEVVSTGPRNAQVRYTTLNGKTKTVAEDLRLLSKIDDSPPRRPTPRGYSRDNTGLVVRESGPSDADRGRQYAADADSSIEDRR